MKLTAVEAAILDIAYSLLNRVLQSVKKRTLNGQNLKDMKELEGVVQTVGLLNLRRPI